MKCIFFWHMTLYWSVCCAGRFDGTSCLHLHCLEVLEPLSAQHKHTTIPRNVSPHNSTNSSTAVSHTVLWLAVQFSCNIQHWQHCEVLCELLWWAAVVDGLGSVRCTCQTVRSYCRATCLSGWPTNFVISKFPLTQLPLWKLCDIYLTAIGLTPGDSSTVQYSTVQYSTVQYTTVQYRTVQYSTVQYTNVQYSAVH